MSYCYSYPDGSPWVVDLKPTSSVDYGHLSETSALEELLQMMTDVDPLLHDPDVDLDARTDSDALNRIYVLTVRSCFISCSSRRLMKRCRHCQHTFIQCYVCDRLSYDAPSALRGRFGSRLVTQ
jgi:hypothetical protein